MPNRKSKKLRITGPENTGRVKASLSFSFGACSHPGLELYHKFPTCQAMGVRRPRKVLLPTSATNQGLRAAELGLPAKSKRSDSCGEKAVTAVQLHSTHGHSVWLLLHHHHGHHHQNPQEPGTHCLRDITCKRSPPCSLSSSLPGHPEPLPFLSALRLFPEVAPWRFLLRASRKRLGPPSLTIPFKVTNPLLHHCCPSSCICFSSKHLSQGHATCFTYTFVYVPTHQKHMC